jgi:hypothetical protein
VIDVLGRPWVFWGTGAVLVGSSLAAKQGAAWWVALLLGVVAGLVVGGLIWALRDAELRRFGSNRPVRALVAHLRGERRSAHEPDDDVA